MSIEDLYGLFKQHPLVSTDTRQILDNSIFFALKGERFNGNTFAAEALESGAAYAVIDEAEFKTDHRTILVDDVLEALQQLATYHRKHCKAKIIGLTGSNGKTTTKELLNAVLSQTYDTLATQGNFNNHIGVPLTLLRIAEETEMAIIEMGANHIGEIAALCEIARPEYGYITNFGKAHLEGFGSEEGVVQGKSELYRHIMANNGHLFINADDGKQLELTRDYVKKYGFSRNDPQFTLIKYRSGNSMVGLEVDGVAINSQLPGEYNFDNCAAAVLIGKYFNVPLHDIKAAIEGYIPENNRSQLIHKNGHTIILDAYNANPTSVAAALDNLQAMDGEYKVAVLGDMLELGKTSTLEHESMVNRAQELKLDALYLFGPEYGKTQNHFRKFDQLDDLVASLSRELPQEAVILIKGSRGMALERLVERLWP